MLKRIIEWSVNNRLIVLLFTVAALGGGIWALSRTPLEALPDLSDVQVIVQAEYNEQAPRIVEDQVTYPIAAEMLKVPGARTVRGYSFFGVSFVYVIFEDATDLYWARSRVLEYLSGIKGRCRRASRHVSPTPRAWVGLPVRAGRHTGKLTWRNAQRAGWYLRYALTAVPGVSRYHRRGFEKRIKSTSIPRSSSPLDPRPRVMSAIQNPTATLAPWSWSSPNASTWCAARLLNPSRISRTSSSGTRLTAPRSAWPSSGA